MSVRVACSVFLACHGPMRLPGTKLTCSWRTSAHDMLGIHWTHRHTLNGWLCISLCLPVLSVILLQAKLSSPSVCKLTRHTRAKTDPLPPVSKYLADRRQCCHCKSLSPRVLSDPRFSLRPSPVLQSGSNKHVSQHTAWLVILWAANASGCIATFLALITMELLHRTSRNTLASLIQVVALFFYVTMLYITIFLSNNMLD